MRMPVFIPEPHPRSRPELWPQSQAEPASPASVTAAVVASLWLAATLVVGACAPTEAPPPAERVALTVTPAIANGRLTIEGTTDLPDGAILSYEARHENWAVAGEPIWLRSGQIVVEGGAYSERLRLRRWPTGAVEVWVAFQTMLADGAQPAAVLERFGELGERLAGENVTEAGPLRRVELSVTLQPGR